MYLFFYRRQCDIINYKDQSKNKPMKSIYLLLFYFSMIGFSHSQIQPYSIDNFTMREFPVSMSEGMKNGFTLEFEGLSNKEIIKLWEDFMKPYGKAGRDRKSKEYFIDDARIPGLNRGNTVDFYSKVDEVTKTRSSLTVWVNLGGAYINSKDHPDDFQTLKNMLLVFEKNAYKAMVENQISEENKALKVLENDLNKVTKANEKLSRDIENYKDRIIKAEQEIQENEKTIESKNQEIDLQKENLIRVQDLLKSAG